LKNDFPQKAKFLHITQILGFQEIHSRQLMKQALLIFLFALASTTLFSQDLNRKEVRLARIESPPKIDGKLDDAAWRTLEPLRDFVMFQPGNGLVERAAQRTEIFIGYDDEAVYIGAMMYDASPDSILTQLTQRDDLNGNTDWVGFFINPFNDGLNDFNFWVTAAGVQIDGRTTSEGDDLGWDVVWSSQTQINDSGWVAELKIPYRCLRFPKTRNSTWGFNSIRSIRRYREEYSWSFLDRNINNLEVQAGQLTGIQDIKAPIRLSIMPNLTGNASFYKGELESSSFNAGADIKYGITESFTLDVTLLPDFSQVAFDNQVLNLGPFENRFDENRQFFTEGVELFNKRDLFYSRRIGGAPTNITGANADSLDNVNLEFTRMLNATKISGRTGGNLGIGVLNAVTANNFIQARDPETDEEVSILTEPMTNFNIVSFEQRFRRNSSISLINTNVLRDGQFRDANVTSLMLDLADRSNQWRLFYQFANSNIFENDTRIGGFRSLAILGEEAGKFRFELGQSIISDTYDQNDLGFQTRNNRFNHWANFRYGNIQPEGAFNRYRFELTGTYRMLYDPREFEESSLRFEAFGLLRSFNAFGYQNEWAYLDRNDFYEPRYWGQKFIRPSSFWQEAWLSTDYRKVFALDARIGHWFWSDYQTQGYYFRIAPRVRVNDHLMLILDFRPNWEENDIGWVNNLNGTADSIVMGRRDIREFSTSMEARYVFTPYASLTVNFRHYWSNVRYNDYWLLQEDGLLQEFRTYPEDHNINFNTLNIDVRFSWWFAPGSEMVLLYRNTLASDGGPMDENYIYNLNESLRTPQHHMFSLRIVYFLDYNDVVRKFNHDKSKQYSQALWQGRSTARY
jgi:hypothetical protein